jgi:hypothetical protein
MTVDPNLFDAVAALLRVAEKSLCVLSFLCLLLAFGWLFMFDNIPGFVRCSLMALVCALIAQNRPQDTAGW